ncbi:MAG: diaminopimelate decarboxylase [Polyangiaceae bacterium]|nr:diaminopimelate decarboxylase [Polyangiaceae bacterium]
MRDERGAAHLGGVPLADLLSRGIEAGGFATPVYVYDLDAIANEARALIAAFGSSPHLVAYAIKANSAGPIVRVLAKEGCGIEVVTGSELMVALACGVSPDRILYSGVAKTDAEIDQAVGAGDRGILAIQMESVEEIPRVNARARALGRRARASIRINPSVIADTHAHVATGHDEAKFGVAKEDLPAAWEALEKADLIDLTGLSCHVGSQLTRTDDYLAAARELLSVAAAREASHGPLSFVDFGGGYGIDYGSGCPVKPADFAAASVKLCEGSKLAGRTLVVEPGRSLVAAHGVLCARVIMSKRSRSTPERRWLMIDAGMNDLIRPALYGARHRIEPLSSAPPSPESGAPGWRVVGPVCESSDDFGEHLFDEPPSFVVIRDAGAYGFTMASEYNGRPHPTEVFLSGERVVAVGRSRDAAAWARERAEIGEPETP